MTPIILHHGYMNIGDIRLGPIRLPCFRDIDTAIANRGHPVIVTRVHPWASIIDRARQLKRCLLTQMKARRLDFPVVILAHSMGGLDARYMLTHLGMADRVKALVTISTPHRGSPYADYMLRRVGLLRLGGAALRDMTLAACRRFNDLTPDVPSVAYYSVSAALPEDKIPLFGRLAWRIVSAAEGPNDGHVSVSSAIWGTHLGTWPADHWEERNIWLPGLTRNSSAYITPRWLALLDRLATDRLLNR